MRKIFGNKKADVSAVGTIVALLLVIVVGMLVYWSISSSISTGSTQGAIAHRAVNNTSGMIFQLLPIVAIVFIASIMLVYITRFSGAGGV